MDKLQEPEQAGSLIVLYNCKHCTSALIHHLLCFSNKIVCFLFLQISKYKEKISHTVKLKKKNLLMRKCFKKCEGEKLWLFYLSESINSKSTSQAVIKKSYSKSCFA